MYAKYKTWLKIFEKKTRLKEDEFSQPDGAKILIVGMGRLGTHAYEFLKQEFGNQVCGVEASSNRVIRHNKAGRNVISGDAEDADFWEQVDLSKIELILLALPTLDDIVVTTQQLSRMRYQGKITTTAKYEDERSKLLEAGVDIAFYFYAEAGKGFAIESRQLLD